MTLSVTFFFDSSADAVVVAVATVVTAVATALNVAERASVVDMFNGWVYCVIFSRPRATE